MINNYFAWSDYAKRNFLRIDFEISKTLNNKTFKIGKTRLGTLHIANLKFNMTFTEIEDLLVYIENVVSSKPKNFDSLEIQNNEIKMKWQDMEHLYDTLKNVARVCTNKLVIGIS